MFVVYNNNSNFSQDLWRKIRAGRLALARPRAPPASRCRWCCSLVAARSKLVEPVLALTVRDDYSSIQSVQCVSVQRTLEHRCSAIRVAKWQAVRRSHCACLHARTLCGCPVQSGSSDWGFPKGRPALPVAGCARVNWREKRTRSAGSKKGFRPQITKHNKITFLARLLYMLSLSLSVCLYTASLNKHLFSANRSIQQQLKLWLIQRNLISKPGLQPSTSMTSSGTLSCIETTGLRASGRPSASSAESSYPRPRSFNYLSTSYPLPFFLPRTQPRPQARLV